MSNAWLESVKVDFLGAEHLTEIVEIEKKSFAKPWTRSSFLQTLSQKNYEGIGTFYLQTLVGYCFYYWAADEFNIINIATDPAYRGKKIGTLLLAEVEKSAQKKQCKTIFLEVSVLNLIAQSLYQKMGYRKQSRRMGYYPDGQDALVMCKDFAY